MESASLDVPLKRGPALYCAARCSGYHIVKPASARSQWLDQPQFVHQINAQKVCQKRRSTRLEKVILFNRVTTNILFLSRPLVKIRDASILLPGPGIGTNTRVEYSTRKICVDTTTLIQFCSICLCTAVKVVTAAPTQKKPKNSRMCNGLIEYLSVSTLVSAKMKVLVMCFVL